VDPTKLIVSLPQPTANFTASHSLPALSPTLRSRSKFRCRGPWHLPDHRRTVVTFIHPRLDSKTCSMTSAARRPATPPDKPGQAKKKQLCLRRLAEEKFFPAAGPRRKLASSTATRATPAGPRCRRPHSEFHGPVQHRPEYAPSGQWSTTRPPRTLPSRRQTTAPMSHCGDRDKVAVVDTLTLQEAMGHAKRV